MEEPVSGPSDEQIPGEGGNEETGVITPVAEDPVPETPVEEPTPADPVEEPAVDEPVAEEPAEEAPIEEPVVEEPIEEDETPAESEGTDVVVNADEEKTKHTVSIKDYRKVLDSVTISASDGSDLDITNDGKITVEDGKTLSLTIAANDHWKIKSVKSGETAWSGSGPYTKKIEEDTEVTIEVVATYTFALDVTAATGVTLQRLTTDAEGKAKKEAFADGEIEKDGEALKLVTSGYTANNDSLTFSYGTDGEAPEVLAGVEEEDPTSAATPKEKVMVYTIPANVVASLDSLSIVLVKNEQVAVTFAVNANVEVKVWGVKTPATETAAAVMDYVDIPTGGYKVISGEKAKFKATAKDYYKITAVNAKDPSDGDAEPAKVCDASANGEYELVVTAATEYSFVTEIDSEKSKSLSFNLAADKGSATAKVTGVTLKAVAPATTDTVLSGDDLTAFLTGIGIAGGALDPEATEAVKIPNSVKDITVEVKAGTDYKLSKINNEAVKTDPDESTTATRKIAYESIGEVKVETTAKASTDATYFAINPNKYDATNNTTGVKNIEVDTGASTAADATVKAVDGTPNTYVVKSGTETVSIKITANEGWALEETFLTALKAISGVADVASEVKDKKTVYTVKLLAKNLGAEGSATDLGTVAEAVQKFTAAVDAKASSDDGYVEGDYTITPAEAFPLVGADADNIPYNAKLETTITAASGYTLKSVSGTMGGTALPAIEVLKVAGTDTATIEIAKVTGDVKFKVETAPAYTITLDAVTGTDAPTQPVAGDETWAVKYNGKYTVNVAPAVDIKDLSAEIKDGTTVVGRGRKISGELQLWMLKAWAGKELTVEVNAKDTKIGELVLQVNKQRSTLNIKSEGTIKQDVASKAVYEIETDGEKLPTSVVPAVTGALSSKLTAAINAKGNLEVTVAPAKFADVNTVTTTGTGEEQVRTVTPNQAVITITDPESNGTLKTKVTVEANAIFDTDSKPSVSLVDGGASDTMLNVNVGMDGVIAPKDGTSKVYYVITAKAKANVPASGDTPASNRDAQKLEETKTEIVERRGSSQRVALQVGTSTNLGEGAEWDYDVTAKAVYALDGVEPTSVTSETVAADTNSDVSALSDKLETKTVTPLFEAGLKLKKDNKKKPASTLYTGQTNLYIATPQWSKKNVNYKITEATVTDSGYGITAKIDDAGDLVVTSVATTASLGKHTLTVTAKADETTNHTMYASRATINVTVVPGINSLGVSIPADQIFKKANTAATFKATPVYTKKWDGKKYVDPKAKKVTWSIVGGDSSDNDSSNIDGFTLTAAPAGITIKNGTITVAKNFTVDARHPKNNEFRVLVQAADFAGNTTAALSDKITVTSNAADVSNLAIAKRNIEKGGYDVIAVKTGTKSDKAQDVKAEDIHGAYVYAMSGTVAPGFVSNAKWDTLGVVSPYNLKYAPAKGNFIVNSFGRITTVASGKKATITVTTTDGGKKKNSIALNMGYTEADPTAALQITATDADGNRATPIAVKAKPSKEADAAAKVEKEYDVPGVAKLDVTVYAAVRNDKGAFTKFEEISNYANYKLTVKGGKIASDGEIYTTAKVTTLNLTVGAGKTAKKYTYVLTNKAYEETAKAKVTVKNSLHTSGSYEEQKVKMVALNGKDSFGDNKYAKVELDKTAMPKYNPSNTTPYYAWWAINNSIKSNYIKLNKDTGEFDLEFVDWYSDSGYVSFAAGSYKLKVTIGEGATAAAFKAKTQPVNVTLKVVKNKAFTFKPVTSYTINKVDGGAVLTGKANLNAKAGEMVYTNFTKLQNANVNGKSNLFTHYFTIASDPVTGTQRITLNTEDPLVEKLLYETKEDGTIDKSKRKADPDLTSISKDKANLTGYLTYTAGSNTDYYDSDPVTNTVKITVKIAPEAKNNKYKATQKYIPEGGTEIGLKKNATTQVNILVNGYYVSVAHAIVDETKAKSNAPELSKEVSVNNKGQIVLKADADLDATKKGGYSINLLIVPATSFFARAITDTTKAEDKKALIQRYGTPVKVTVVAKEKPKATADPSAEPDEPVVPPTPAEKTQAEVEAMVETWIGTLTGTNTWLKNDTTAATLTTKANADASIAASGWIVTVTAATFTGATAATADAAATQGAPITYTLKKGADGTPTSPITSTAKITLPAGAIATSEVVTAVGALTPKVTVAGSSDAAAIKTAATTALTGMPGKTNIDHYYTFTVGDVTGTISAADDTATVAVTVIPEDGGTAGNAIVTVTGE